MLFIYFFIYIQLTKSASVSVNSGKGEVCLTLPSLRNGYVRKVSLPPKHNLLAAFENQSISPPTEETNFIPTEKSRKLFSTNDYYLPGTIVEYECQNNYGLKPPGTKYICERGMWHGPKSYCVTKGCVKPSPVINGYYLELSEAFNGLFKTGSRLEFLCHKEYILEGPGIFTCQSSGKWKPDILPECSPSTKIKKQKLCSIPPDVLGADQTLLRGDVTSEGAVHLTVVEYRCRSGYRNAIAPCNTQKLTCEQGRWMGTSPQCEKFSSCLTPPSILNGYLYDVASAYPIHSQVYYVCGHRFRLVGPAVLTCQSSGCWFPMRPPLCEPSLPGSNEVKYKSQIHLQFSLIGIICIMLTILVVILIILLWHRSTNPKLFCLRGSCRESVPQRQCPGEDAAGGSPSVITPRNPFSADRVALIPFPDEIQGQNVPPSYEEATRQRPAVVFDHSVGRLTPHMHRSRGHRVVVSQARRSRHRDNPDNISYQSIGSARQSSGTSRSMSMRSWSACDSLGSTDTVAVSDSTNVTVETMSSCAFSGISQNTSCRALAGSRASFDTSSLVNNEGAPLLEEIEGEDYREEDFSTSTRDSDSLKDNVSRSVTVNSVDQQ